MTSPHPRLMPHWMYDDDGTPAKRSDHPLVFPHQPPVGHPLSRRHALCAIWVAEQADISAADAAYIVNQVAIWLDSEATTDDDITRLLGGPAR